MKSVACFGGLHRDVKARLREPLRTGTSNPVTTTRGVGGVATNVARSLARLGVPVRLVSMVGEDGSALVDEIERDGVDVGGVETMAGSVTASYTAILSPDGALQAGLADMEIYEQMDREWGLRRSHAGDLWFAETNIPTDALQALQASAAGRPWFVDPVSVAKAGRLSGVIEGATCVFPDALEAAALTGEHEPERAATALLDAGAEYAVVTLGEGGVVCAGAHGAEHRAAIRPEKVRDVTGAGDAFAAGFVAAHALDADDPVGWGLAAASLAVESLETVPGDLSLPALLARI